MKHFIHSAAAIMSSFVCLVSCTEQESDLLSANQSSNNQLSIVTHTREGETPIASVYLFNANNAFVRTLQTDAAGDYSSASASVKLPAGSYTICAINSSGLSHFQLPDETTATPTSVISVAEGQTMGDLLMDMKTVTLTNGDNAPVDMELQRKVLELSSVTISQVPEDVIGVTVSVGSFSSAIQFNGTYVDTDPITCTFSLTHNTTTGNWESTPQQLVFPSIGRPSITITFNRGEEDTHSYTYNASAALSANNKYDITGTYTEVSFSGTITSQDWPADPIAIDFEFDESSTASNTTPDPNEGGDDPSSGTDDPNSGASDPADLPVVGQTYKGCYVVSVNSDTKKAVLISPTEKRSYNGGNGGASSWLNKLNIALSSWEVDGISGTWRIPTLEEMEDISAYPDVLGIRTGGCKEYFCLIGSELKEVSLNRKSENAGGYIEIISEDITDNYDVSTFLRPVIDISYD